MTDTMSALGPTPPATLGAAWLRRLARRVGASVTPPILEREVVTIESFARYLAHHPDMPLEHRARFLKQIRESCAEIRREFC